MECHGPRALLVGNGDGNIVCARTEGEYLGAGCEVRFKAASFPGVSIELPYFIVSPYCLVRG